MEQKRLSLQDQIARLEQTRVDLAALEEEWSKREQTEGEVTELRKELDLIRARSQHQEKVIQSLQQEFRSYYAKSQGIFSMFSKVLHKETENLEQEIDQAYSTTSSHLEKLLDLPLTAPLPKPEKITEAVAKEIASVPVLEIEEVKDEESTSPGSKKKKAPRFKLVRYSAILAIVLIGGTFTTHFSNHSGTPLAETGQVAGVSTTSPTATALPAEFPNSFNKVSFDNSTLKDLDDPEFYLKMQVYSNAMDVQHTENNLYILRQDDDSNNVTYAFKLNTTEANPNQNFDSWVNDQKAIYTDYTFSKTTYAGLPAYQALPNNSNLTGYYFLRYSTFNYTIGYRIKWKNEDDNARQKVLMKSVRFSN